MSSIQLPNADASILGRREQILSGLSSRASIERRHMR